MGNADSDGTDGLAAMVLAVSEGAADSSVGDMMILVKSCRLLKEYVRAEDGVGGEWHKCSHLHPKPAPESVSVALEAELTAFRPPAWCLAQEVPNKRLLSYQ